MGCKPLRWIGVRSYSLYIWHFPVIILTSPAVKTDEASVLRIMLQLAASIILTAFSYKYIEEPFRCGGLKVKWHPRNSTPRHGIQLVFLTAILSLIFIPIACSMNLSKPEPAVQVVETSGSQNVQYEQDKAVLKDESRNESVKDVKEVGKRSVPPAAQDLTHPKENETVTVDIPFGKGITAIGDSVLLDAAPFLEKMLPGIVVDGKVGRQMIQAQDSIDRLKTEGKLGDRIIIELGTNGPFNTKQLRTVLHSLSDAKQIILVNTRVPRKWQDTINADIAEVSNDFGNTTVVDWYSASEGRDNYFYQDGVHLKREGAQVYASILPRP